MTTNKKKSVGLMLSLVAGAIGALASGATFERQASACYPDTSWRTPSPFTTTCNCTPEMDSATRGRMDCGFTWIDDIYPGCKGIGDCCETYFGIDFTKSDDECKKHYEQENNGGGGGGSDGGGGGGGGGGGEG